MSLLLLGTCYKPNYAQAQLDGIWPLEGISDDVESTEEDFSSAFGARNKGGTYIYVKTTNGSIHIRES